MLQKRYFSISILGTVTFLFNFDFMIWKFTLLGFKNRILIQPCLYERVLWEGECDLLERRCSTTYVIICDYRQPSRFQCIWFERGEWEMCVSWTFCDSSSFTCICMFMFILSSYLFLFLRISSHAHTYMMKLSSLLAHSHDAELMLEVLRQL